MGCGSSNVSSQDPIGNLARMTGLPRSFIEMYFHLFNSVCPGTEMNQQQFVAMFMKLHKQTDNPFFAKFLERVFLLFDVDGNGTVSMGEVLTILNLVINGDVGVNLVLIFRLCDTDRSDSVEKEEFISTVQDLAVFIPGHVLTNKETLTREATEAFSKMDTAEKGSITGAEYFQSLNENNYLVERLIVFLLKALVRIVTANPPVLSIV